MNRINEYRKNAGISLKNLSQQTKINYNTLRSYEYGYRDIKKMQLITAVKLSNILGCNPQDLISKQEKEYKNV